MCRVLAPGAPRGALSILFPKTGPWQQAAGLIRFPCNPDIVGSKPAQGLGILGPSITPTRPDQELDILGLQMGPLRWVLTVALGFPESGLHGLSFVAVFFVP